MCPTKQPLLLLTPMPYLCKSLHVPNIKADERICEKHVYLSWWWHMIQSLLSMFINWDGRRLLVRLYNFMYICQHLHYLLVEPLMVPLAWTPWFLSSKLYISLSKCLWGPQSNIHLWSCTSSKEDMQVCVISLATTLNCSNYQRT